MTLAIICGKPASQELLKDSLDEAVLSMGVITVCMSSEPDFDTGTNVIVWPEPDKVIDMAIMAKAIVLEYSKSALADQARALGLRVYSINAS